MNIKQAKEYIKNSIKIYLQKDEYGDYRIPVVRQRPIFLLGAPGIGKTAIMEQIASELNIALVSYSMTHHTRQSALGLPFITKKTYEGKTYDVSEYTMSEIIATVYETMEKSGMKNGILFLDEINCVSETLAPSMLQFLQYKVFGKHKVPEGWVIVTAGNPPEYNKSVREFDVVTMDRLKVLTVEEDYATWKEYALERGIHSAILSFLELKKDYFYHMETTVKGRSYVTARGWEDLSEIILMYEREGMTVDEELVGQYIRSEEIVREFCAYLDLYNKYKNDYRAEDILVLGDYERALEKVKNAAFDERISLLGMLLEKVNNEMKSVILTSDCLTELMTLLRNLKDAEDITDRLELLADARPKLVEKLEAAGAISKNDRTKHRRIERFLRDVKKLIIKNGISDKEAAFSLVKEQFDKEVAEMKLRVEAIDGMLHRLFEFVDMAFADGNEKLILVTELTVNKYSSRYIGMYGSEDYRRASELMMLGERQKDMRESIEKLELV